MNPHSPSLDRQNHAQAAHIHAMHARRVPEADIAAAAGCTIARVRQVLAQPAPDTDAQPARRTPRADRDAHAPIDTLVDDGTGHDDPSIARLAAHIDGDAQLLRRLLAAYREREETARQLVALDRRRAVIDAENAARHRRRSDGVTA